MCAELIWQQDIECFKLKLPLRLDAARKTTYRTGNFGALLGKRNGSRMGEVC